MDSEVIFLKSKLKLISFVSKSTNSIKSRGEKWIFLDPVIYFVYLCIGEGKQSDDILEYEEILHR